MTPTIDQGGVPRSAKNTLKHQFYTRVVNLTGVIYCTVELYPIPEDFHLWCVQGKFSFLGAMRKCWRSFFLLVLLSRGLFIACYSKWLDCFAIFDEGLGFRDFHGLVDHVEVHFGLLMDLEVTRTWCCCRHNSQTISTQQIRPACWNTTHVSQWWWVTLLLEELLQDFLCRSSLLHSWG